VLRRAVVLEQVFAEGRVGLLPEANGQAEIGEDLDEMVPSCPLTPCAASKGT